MKRKPLTLDPTTGDFQQLPDTDQLNGVDYSYVHDQQVPASTWTVVHNLGRFPSSVTVITSAGDLVWTDVVYDTINQLRIISDGSFTGKVYIS